MNFSQYFWPSFLILHAFLLYFKPILIPLHLITCGFSIFMYLQPQTFPTLYPLIGPPRILPSVPMVPDGHFINFAFRNMQKNELLDSMVSLCPEFYKTGILETYYFRKPMFLIGDPELCRQLFAQDEVSLVKYRRLEFAKMITGDSFALSCGDTYKSHQRLAAQCLSIPDQIPVIVKSFNALLGTIEPLLEPSSFTKVDLQSMIQKTAFQIMGLFTANHDYKVLEGQTEYYDLYIASITEWYDAPLYVHLLNLGRKSAWFSPYIRKFSALAKRLNNHLFDIIRKRQETVEAEDNPTDVLGRILKSNEAQKKIRQDQRGFLLELRDDVFTFFLAGHETTGTTITIAAVYLCKYQIFQDLIRKAILGNDEFSRDPQAYLLNCTVSKLQHDFPLLYIFTLEVMRLEPAAVTTFVRSVTSDGCRIGSHTIPKGSTVLALPYIANRWPEIWGKLYAPTSFHPERFLVVGSTIYDPIVDPELPNNIASFISGPHTCLGKRFAFLEVYIAIILMLSKYYLRLPSDSIHYKKIQYRTKTAIMSPDNVQIELKPLF